MLQVLALLLVGHVLIRQLRVYGTGKQGVAPDLVLGQGDGHGLDHGRHGRLGRRVVHLKAATDKRTDGRDADDGPSSSLFDHLPGRGLEGVKGAVDVGVDGSVEEVFLDPDSAVSELSHGSRVRPHTLGMSMA